MIPKILLDEDIHGPVATGLRIRGIDAMRAQEVGSQGFQDPEQLEVAIKLERAFVSFNRGDFTRLHAEYMNMNHHHYGILVSTQVPPGELIKRIIRCLETEEEFVDRIHYLA
ncbi:MAG TPA: DUF5615 family PIN-like protein [Candidatus Kapabacteria bacterium]